MENEMENKTNTLTKRNSRSTSSIQPEALRNCRQSVRPRIHEEFASKVTLHGYQYLFDPKKHMARRIAWFFILLGSLCIAAYLCFGVCVDYFQYKSYTVVESSSDVPSLDFPTLTFCFNNPFVVHKLKRRSRVSKIFRKVNHQFFKRHFFPQGWTLKSKKKNTMKFWGESGKILIDTPTMKNIYEQFENLGMGYEEILEVFSLGVEDVLGDPIARLFQRKPSSGQLKNSSCTFNSSEKCKKEDFRIVMPHHGLPCLQWNFPAPGKRPKKQMFADIERGFTMYFNIRDDEAYEHGKNGNAISLYVHPYGQPLRHPWAVTEITLEPGKMTTVLMDKDTMIKRLPPPHGTCGTAPYMVMRNTSGYHRDMCRIDCEVHYIIHKCRCVPFFLKSLVGTPMTRRCVESCKDECISHKYNIRTEKKSVVTRIALTKLKNVANESYVRENIVGVRVAFEKLTQRREITTPAVTFMTLIGTIGGSIGLGLGFSVLTLIEFLFFVFDLAFQPVYQYLCR